MARFYDASMGKIEQACLNSWRSELLSGIAGNVLEVGSGTGVNTRHYPASVKKLLLTEPDPDMLAILRNNVKSFQDVEIEVESFSADNILAPDNSFDAAVSTLVLCSVDAPISALNEIRRVLKPGGKLYFIEHVVAKSNPGLIKWQKFFQPFWKFMCGNCHLTRDTEQEILKAGFSLDSIERVKSTGGPPVVSPTIKGIALSLK
jgi:ubiquinone/menaquinone biosynthesis C-methylase UbiE